MKTQQNQPRHIIPFAEALKLPPKRHLAGAAHTPKARKVRRTWLPYCGEIGEESGSGHQVSHS